MYWNILKKDLKRKKTMNVILLMFVIIATMFVASSVNNILATLNGTDYFFEQAGIGDYVILQQGGKDAGEELKATLDDCDINDYKVEDMILLSPQKLKFESTDDKKMENSFILMPISESKVKLFDAQDNVLTSVEKGKVRMPNVCMQTLGLEPGDTIGFAFDDGWTAEFEIAGISKDVIFGAKMFNTPRFVLNDEDYEEVFKHIDGTVTECRIVYAECSDLSLIKNSVTKLNGVLFSDTTKTLKAMYLIDVVIAAILMAVSICLILVAVVVLRFTISFTLTEEFREIGVMKAIGIRNGKIRALYIVKYIGIAVIGSIIGFIVSIPFGNMLLRSVSDQMVLGSSSGILVNIISAPAVVLIVFLFSWLCTAGIKKSTPLDAIRSGQTGERYKKKRGIRIGKNRGKAYGFLAMNDVVSSPKSYMTLMIAFSICLTIVLTIVISDSTLAGETLLPTFGTVECDAFLPTEVLDAEKLIAPDGKENFRKFADEIEETLSEEGIPAVVFAEMQINFAVEYGDSSESYRGQMNTGYVHATDYDYCEGSGPESVDEVALSTGASEELDAKIGDTITIIKSDGTRCECMVTGIFQTMNNLGKLIRVHEDFTDDYSQITAFFQPQVLYTDSPSKEVRQERFEKLQELYGDDVLTTSQFVEECIGVGNMITSMKYMVLAVTMVIIALVTVLMERSFIAKEKSEIALMKAIGFKNSAICRLHTRRFTIVSVTASLIAMALAIPVTKLSITPVFASLGASTIHYKVEPLQVFGIYPAIVILITIIAAFFTSLYSNTIKASDASNIE